MRLRQIPFLLLSLFVCVGAFAAPPVVTFEPGNVYATVTPGHRVAWSTTRVYNGSAGFEADSDNDGRVRLAYAFYRSWVVIDVDTGEWTSGGVTESDLPSRTIVPGTSGTYSQIYATGASLMTGVPLWVRPGVGVWKVPMTVYAPPSSVFYPQGAIVDGTQMKPVGNSPATPAGFERGDLLFLLNLESANIGIVDSQFDDTPAPGAFEIGSLITYTPEGATITTNIMRIGGTAGTVSVRCSVSGTAESGIDYPVLAPLEIVFGPGETVKPYTLALQDDSAYNASPISVVLTLSDPTGGATLRPRAAATTTLVDNDPRPLLTFVDVPATVVEGDTPWALDVPFTVTGAFRGTLPVNFKVDYAAAGTFAVTPTERQQIAKAPIGANDDIADLPRQIALHLSSTSPNMVGVTRNVTIVDDDPPRVVIDDAVANESSQTAYLEIRTEWLPSADGDVYWNTVDGTAKAGEDYVAQSGTTSFSTRGIRVTLLDDNVAEGLHVFYVDITSVTGALLPPVRTRVAITIIDDDMAPPTLTVATVSVLEGNVPKYVPLRIELAQPSTSIIELRFDATGNGTATRYQDFWPPSFLFFQPGETSKDAMVRIDGDTNGEPDETAEIAVLDKNLQVLTTTTITILDDDMATTPIITLSATSPVEGDSG